MSALFGFDAFSPKEIAERVRTVGVAKARLALLPMFALAVLAGGFIGLASMFFTLITADAALPFAVSRLLGGLVFSMGLVLVVVAGAELFTGNNLLAMAWAEGQVTSFEVLRNWVVVCAGNLVGACGLAVLVWLANQGALEDGEIGRHAVRIAAAKAALPADVAFFRGVLCNVLVCMAIWMATAGRSVTDKAVAIVLPITAFVAAGFEHSIANMYFFPLAMLLQSDGVALAGTAPVGAADFAANLLPVIAGNLVGGSVLVAGVYWIIYRPDRARP